MPFGSALTGLVPAFSVAQAFPADYFAGLTNGVAKTVAASLNQMPDISAALRTAYRVQMPNFSSHIPDIAAIVGQGISADIVRAFSPSILEVQRTALRTFSQLADTKAPFSIPTPDMSSFPSPDELLDLGRASTSGEGVDPEFVSAAAETVQKIDGAEETIERYISSLSGYASEALELIREGIYTFVFVSWVLVVLGLSNSVPPAEALIVAAPLVAKRVQKGWDDIVENT